MNPYDYGKVLVSNIIPATLEGITFERFIVVSGNKTYQIDVFEGGKVNKVTILGSIKLSWIDTKVSDDLIKREIKKSSIYFMDGEIILRKKELPAKPFRRLQKESVLSNKFYTMDIETITKDDKITPYLINGYDGRHHLTSFNSNESELFQEFIEKLISAVEKGSKTYVYAHNLSSFDGVLILKHLFKYGEVKPLIHNGEIITIKFIVIEEGIKKTIIFKDSYLLLPLALRKLCVAFNIEVGKGHFPFNLNNLNYSGVFPKLEYWSEITNKEWNHLKMPLEEECGIFN